MKLHSSKISYTDVFDAAREAQAQVEVTKGGSRIRTHGYEVHLTGASHRRPNRRGNHGPDEYAATWDQWGVFLGFLYAIDPDILAGSGPRHAIYEDVNDFNRKTNGRFIRREEGFWPLDSHGDHMFKSSAPFTQACTKCSATRTFV